MNDSKVLVCDRDGAIDDGEIPIVPIKVLVNGTVIWQGHLCENCLDAWKNTYDFCLSILDRKPVVLASNAEILWQQELCPGCVESIPFFIKPWGE